LKAQRQAVEVKAGSHKTDSGDASTGVLVSEFILTGLFLSSWFPA
jgi:hypothetical protein